MEKANELCCLLGLEHGWTLLFHYHKLAISLKGHCLNLEVLELAQ